MQPFALQEYINKEKNKNSTIYSENRQLRKQLEEQAKQLAEMKAAIEESQLLGITSHQKRGAKPKTSTKKKSSTADDDEASNGGEDDAQSDEEENIASDEEGEFKKVTIVDFRWKTNQCREGYFRVK